MELVIGDVMTRFPTTVVLGTTVRQAAALVAASEVGQLMVVDEAGGFVGALAEGDLLRALLPDGEELRAAGGTVTAGFGVFLTKAGAAADHPVDALVVRDPIVIAPDADVAAAAVVMTGRGLRRLPVVADGRLVGTVSRIDLCRAVLAHAPVPDRRPGDVAAPPPVTPPAATPATTNTVARIPTKPDPQAATARIAAARERLAAATRLRATPPTATHDEHRG